MADAKTKMPMVAVALTSHHFHFPDLRPPVFVVVVHGTSIDGRVTYAGLLRFDLN